MIRTLPQEPWTQGLSSKGITVLTNGSQRLFDGIFRKTRVGGDGLNVLTCQIHIGSSQSRSRIVSDTMMFHLFTSLPPV